MLASKKQDAISLLQYDTIFVNQKLWVILIDTSYTYPTGNIWRNITLQIDNNGYLWGVRISRAVDLKRYSVSFHGKLSIYLIACLFFFF